MLFCTEEYIKHNFRQMKYHSPISIIIISLIVLLLFVSVAFFAVFSIGLTSPTLIVTERLMSSLEKADSNLSFSFDSMERNLRGGFTINNLEVGYKDESVVSLERLRVHMGIPALLRYLVLGDGNLEIEGINGSISIPDITGSGESSGESGFSIPEFSRSISLHLHNIDISGMGVETEKAEISAYLSATDQSIRCEMNLPSITVDESGFSISGDNILLRAVYRDEISLSASGGGISFSSEDVSVEAVRPVVQLTAENPEDKESFVAALSFSSLSGNAFGSEFSVAASSLHGTIANAEAVLTSIEASYESYGIKVAEADFSIIDGMVSVFLENAEISAEDMVIYKADSTEAAYNTTNGRYRFTTPYFTSEAATLVGFDFPISGSSISVRGRYGDSLVLSAGGHIGVSEEGSVLNGTGGDFSISLRTDVEGKLTGNASIEEFYLPGMLDDGYLFLSVFDGGASIQGAFGNRLVISGEMKDGLRLSAFYTDLPLNPFMPIVSEYVPVLYNYIGKNTLATGNISINFDENMTGPMDFALALSDIAFNDFSFSLAASGSGTLKEDGVDVSQLSLTSDFIRASYSGSINFRTNLPEGRFVISRTDSGKELFVADLTLQSDEEYIFSAFIPRFSSSYLRGNVNWSDENVIESSATLKSGDYYYPFDIRIDFAENIISVENEHAHSLVSFGEEIDGSLTFDHFELPVFRDEQITPAFLDGTLNVYFSFSEQQLRINAEDFRVGDIGLLPHYPDLVFSVTGDNTSLTFNEISFSSVFPELSGRVYINYVTPSVAMMFTSSADEVLRLSIVREEDGMFSGLLRADSFDLGRFGITDMVGDINLTARAGTWDSLAFSGNIKAESRDMINNPVAMEAGLNINRNEITLSAISFTSGNLSLSSDEVSFSADTGKVTAELSLSTALERADKMLPVSTSLKIDALLASGENLYASILSMYRSRLENVYVNISLGKTDLGGMFEFDERSVHIVRNNDNLLFTGNLINGSYDLSAERFDLDVNLDPVAVFSVDGMKQSDGMELRFGIDSFEISVADLFLNPSISFIGPAPAHGEIIAVKEGQSWVLSGFLAAEEVSFDVFWMPGERVILHNPYFAVWNNSFSSIIDDCTVLELDTYERTPGRVALTIDLSSSLSMDGWYVDVYAEEDNWIGIRLPLSSSNVDIWGDVTGYLRVGERSDSVIYLNGDLKAANLTMSIGMEPMPEWMLRKSDTRTTSDLSLLLTENVKFVFPLTGDPILRADLAEYQSLNVKVDEMGQLDVSGSLDIRSGEIFYFQKNFYITEGNISFRQSPTDMRGFNPIINLRARLRDFDSDGNQVDIYLNLRDATMDNLSPSFESSPSKPLSEIMQILGQSILPNSVYGDISVSSMVSIVSASVDILSRFGIIASQNDNTLEQSIRSSLSLDTFSLHTNIIENLIYDTVSYASSNLNNDMLSPMARYLDGTTLYLGKYLSPELYLEGMIHLDADSNQLDTQHTFLADDLNLDIEISLEWDNPLAVFNIFTRPDNITLYDIIDTFGFGVSKRIVW